MNREELITHLPQLIRRVQEAGKTYNEALEWSAISADHTRIEYKEPEEPILYKYDPDTDVFNNINVGMSNQILQYVVENWDAIKPHVLEDLRKTWLDVENEYLTCLEELRTALDDDKPHNKKGED
ncbi:MAG: hypothetical protein M0P69_12375 [Bacteroidales bacterium]|jgi:hypothetical protein|nr:hypothetical protein [Bacteroidales bacterium]